MIGERSRRSSPWAIKGVARQRRYARAACLPRNRATVLLVLVDLFGFVVNDLLAVVEAIVPRRADRECAAIGVNLSARSGVVLAACPRDAGFSGQIVKRRREDLMEIGFFFWPFTLQLVEQMAERAERYGYAVIGIADTPGNAMDPGSRRPWWRG